VSAPPAPFVPPALHFQPVIGIAACYVGPVEEGQQVLQGVRSFGQPAVDTFGVQPYTAIQQWFDAGVPHGLHYHCRSEWLDPLDSDALDALAQAAADRTSPLSQVLVRSVRHILTVAAAWEPGDERAEVHRQWCRDAWNRLRPWSAGGGYVNHLTDEGADRTREAYGAQTWERLVAAKRRYDPANLFRMNQNIDPGTTALKRAAG